MRIVPLLLASCLAGCSAAPYFQGSRDGIPSESVRTYAKAHGLSRDEARRELELYRDAEYLKELRQERAAASSAAAEVNTGEGQQSSR